MVYRPPIPEWNEPLIADSITGIIGPKILESYWMNKFGERITRTAPNSMAYLLVRTQCYPVGSKLTVTLSKGSGEDFSTGEKTITRYIYSDEDGIAILANNIWK